MCVSERCHATTLCLRPRITAVLVNLDRQPACCSQLRELGVPEVRLRKLVRREDVVALLRTLTRTRPPPQGAGPEVRWQAAG